MQCIVKEVNLDKNDVRSCFYVLCNSFYRFSAYCVLVWEQYVPLPICSVQSALFLRVFILYFGRVKWRWRDMSCVVDCVVVMATVVMVLQVAWRRWSGCWCFAWSMNHLSIICQSVPPTLPPTRNRLIKRSLKRIHVHNPTKLTCTRNHNYSFQEKHTCNVISALIVVNITKLHGSLISHRCAGLLHFNFAAAFVHRKRYNFNNKTKNIIRLWPI